MVRADIIVGAGVIGASTAYHLKRLDPGREVILIDMGRRIGEGATAKSAALYRNIFSSGASRMLATSSIRYYLELGNKVQVDPIGYLWLFSEDQWNGSSDAIGSLDRQRDGIGFLDVKDICGMVKANPMAKGPFPGISRGILGSMCGSLSGMGLAQHYGDEFRSLGGEVLLGRKVEDVRLSGGGEGYAPWTGVKALSVIDSSGEEHKADHFTFALGPWSFGLLSRIGIFPGVLPKKRQLFGIRIDEPSQIVQEGFSGRLPAMILPAGGVYIKPMLEKRLMLLGLADDLGRPYSMDDAEPEPHYFDKAIRPVLSHYLPALRDYELKMRWAGFYSYHWPDKNPVVETLSNITWSSGTSGSGIMKADAIGRVTASRLLGFKEAELFDGSRIRVADLSLRERNVGMERFVI